MPRTPHPVGSEVSFSARDDGTVEAIYVRFSNMPISATKEIDGDTLLADYDENDDLVGIEILAPVRIATLMAIVDSKKRASLQRFMQKQGPMELVLT